MQLLCGALAPLQGRIVFSPFCQIYGREMSSNFLLIFGWEDMGKGGVGWEAEGGSAGFWGLPRGGQGAPPQGPPRMDPGQYFRSHHTLRLCRSQLTLTAAQRGLIKSFLSDISGIRPLGRCRGQTESQSPERDGPVCVPVPIEVHPIGMLRDVGAELWVSLSHSRSVGVGMGTPRPPGLAAGDGDGCP